MNAIDRIIAAITEFDRYEGLPPGDTPIMLITEDDDSSCQWVLTYEDNGEHKRLTLNDLREFVNEL